MYNEPVAQLWRWARIIGGFTLLAVGIAGLFLPIIQGIALIVAGLLLLAREYHWARRLLDWVRRKREEPQPPSAGAAGL